MRSGFAPQKRCVIFYQQSLPGGVILPPVKSLASSISTLHRKRLQEQKEMWKMRLFFLRFFIASPRVLTETWVQLKPVVSC
jgi:hypothetical protein